MIEIGNNIQLICAIFGALHLVKLGLTQVGGRQQSDGILLDHIFYFSLYFTKAQHHCSYIDGFWDEIHSMVAF